MSSNGTEYIYIYIYIYVYKNCKYICICFRYDFVKVYDGDSNTASVLGSFTGNNLPSGITSTGHSILIHLLSDHSMVKNGFRIQYDTGKEKAGSMQIS